MRKLTVLLIAVSLLLCACGAPKLDSLQIQTAQDLLKLAQCYDGQVTLNADIDLAGAQWTPVDFNGTFVGNGHTISNFTVQTATKDGNQGFFGLLGSNASISDLTLADVTVTECPQATAVGVLAGKNQGSITQCNVGMDAPYENTVSGNRQYLTGQMDNSTVTDSRTSGVSVGAIAGINEGTVKAVKSYVRLYTDPALKAGLVGTGSGSAEGQWLDVSNQPVMSEGALAMRQTIVDRMAAEGSVQWTPTKDMTFTTGYSNGTDVVYAAGTTYTGLPYTQKYGSLERMEYCLNEDGTVKDWLSPFSDAADQDTADDQLGWDLYIGNDCSGGVYWAWNRTCASVSFLVTQHMVPTMDHQANYGCLPVGDYAATTQVTRDVFLANGSPVLLECYAKLRMGDAIVTYGASGGHTRLVAADPVVMRNADGTLDMAGSYVVTHEQGVALNSSGNNSTWLLNGRYPFAILMTEFYVPITTMELQIGEAAVPMPKAMDITGPTTGRVFSNYRIISTTVKLENTQTGDVVEDMRFTALCTATRDADAAVVSDGPARTTIRMVDLQEHAAVLEGLASGTYQYTVSALLSNGESYEIQTGEYTK